jgi:hypothetical protein
VASLRRRDGPGKSCSPQATAVAAYSILRHGRVDALADVGLTARFSRTLADAGISCNVIAGLAHDHLFVPWDQGAQALALLRAL